MSGDTRAIYRPGRDRPPPGNAMPIGPTREAISERREIEEYLASQMLVPVETRELTGERGGRASPRQVNEAMDTMTIAERIHLEIEMTQRGRALYSADYDPLRF